MRAEELQIGDWVRNDLGEIQQVVELREEGAMLSYNDIYQYGDIQPIPLTPEILEKNGFIKDKENEYSITYHILIPTGYEKNSYTIQITFYKVPLAGVNVLFKCWGWLPPENSGMNDIHMCNVEHVHQLQHALRLCGITKEIQI